MGCSCRLQPMNSRIGKYSLTRYAETLQAISHVVGSPGVSHGLFSPGASRSHPDAPCGALRVMLLCLAGFGMACLGGLTGQALRPSRGRTRRAPGTTLRVLSATPRAKTEYPWPGGYPHSHSASGAPLVDPRTTSRSTKMSSSLRGLL